MKTRLVLYLIATIGAFAFGRYTASYKPQVITKYIQTQVIKREVRTITKTRDGGTKIEETIDTVSNSRESETRRIKTSKISVSALASVSPKTGQYTPEYGIHVSKEFIGPITIGAFGMTNGIVGLSLGVNF